MVEEDPDIWKPSASWERTGRRKSWMCPGRGPCPARW